MSCILLHANWVIWAIDGCDGSAHHDAAHKSQHVLIEHGAALIWSHKQQSNQRANRLRQTLEHTGRLLSVTSEPCPCNFQTKGIAYKSCWRFCHGLWITTNVQARTILTRKLTLFLHIMYQPLHLQAAKTAIKGTEASNGYSSE